MYEAKPDKPSRSVFVPVLIAGVLIGLLLLATLLPVRVCPICAGVGEGPDNNVVFMENS